LRLVRWLECDRIDQFGGAMRIPMKSPGHSEMMSPGVPT
jgi:hypothetical protein